MIVGMNPASKLNAHLSMVNLMNLQSDIDGEVRLRWRMV